MSAAKRPGPLVRFAASCVGCTYETSVTYRCQGHSGLDVYCDHPSEPGKHIGESTWTTPQWCPLLAGAINAIPVMPKIVLEDQVLSEEVKP